MSKRRSFGKALMIWVAWLIASFAPSAGFSVIPKVKILVVYDQGGFATTSDPYALANSLVTSAQLALVQSGLSLYQYDFEVHPTPVAFNSNASTTNSDVISWMRQVSAVPGSIYDLRFQYGADIVVMIVDTFANSTGQPGLGVQAGVPSSINKRLGYSAQGIRRNF